MVPHRRRVFLVWLDALRDHAMGGTTGLRRGLAGGGRYSLLGAVVERRRRKVVKDRVQVNKSSTSPTPAR